MKHCVVCSELCVVCGVCTANEAFLIECCEFMLGDGHIFLGIQWNLSNPDTLGTEESVSISEESLFQGL